MTECTLLTRQEYEDRRRAGQKHGVWDQYLDPGMMWFSNERWDHTDPDLEQYLPDLLRRARAGHVDHDCLSLNYLTKWSMVRDPVCIVLPDHFVFCPDLQIPDDNRSWDVIGHAPLISIKQGIVTSKGNQFRITRGSIVPESKYGQQRNSVS